MREVHSDFSWLKAVSEARSEEAFPEKTINTIRKHLLQHPIAGYEIEILGRLLQSIQSTYEQCTLPIVRVAVLADFTAEPISNALRVALLRIGYLAVIYQSQFGTYRQEIYSTSSAFYEFNPEFILIYPSPNKVSCQPSIGMTSVEINNIILSEAHQWQLIWSQIRANSRAKIIQHLFTLPETFMLGLAELRSEWSPKNFFKRLNEHLINKLNDSILWVDIETLANYIGNKNWHDARLKFHGKFAFSFKFLPQYMSLLEGVFRGALSKPRKALVVDLDNTLWGGIIGDDGVEGVQLGPESPEGEAYLAFCQYISELGKRGVILAICSKNELKNVIELFSKHPHMPLKFNDFAAVRCNWGDKANNIISLSAELNIDLNSIVFIDDNPVECELINQIVPEVYVINLSGDPATFVNKIDNEMLFDSQQLTSEDLKRTDLYKARQQANVLKATASDLSDYLESLEMYGKIWAAEDTDLNRLSQMESKTNQFNVTTKRWTYDQLKNFQTNPNYAVLCFKMKDRFAEHGLVGSMVIEDQKNTIKILSWLLSCRVFSRTCEEYMFQYVIDLAKTRGIKNIQGEFIQSEKNHVVANLFPNLGFNFINKKNLFDFDISKNSLKNKCFIKHLV